MRLIKYSVEIIPFLADLFLVLSDWKSISFDFSTIFEDAFSIENRYRILFLIWTPQVRQMGCGMMKPENFNEIRKCGNKVY